MEECAAGVVVVVVSTSLVEMQQGCLEFFEVTMGAYLEEVHHFHMGLGNGNGLNHLLLLLLQ